MSRFNPINSLRAMGLAFVLAIAAVAIIDNALAVVLVIMAVGLLVVVVPLVAIHYDEHPDRLERPHPGSPAG